MRVHSNIEQFLHIEQKDCCVNNWCLSEGASKRRVNFAQKEGVHFHLYLGWLHCVGWSDDLVSVVLWKVRMVEGDSYKHQVNKGWTCVG